MIINEMSLDEQELAIEESLLRRKVAKYDFEEFCTYANPRYQVIATQGHRNIHRDLIHVLEDVAKGKLKRLKINCPARLGKSQLGGILLPARYIGRDPYKKFTLASYSANLAGDFSKKARDIVSSKRFQNVFPDFRLASDQKTKTHRETKERGGMYSVGIGGSLTGLGGDILYIDDICKDMQDAQSPVIQDATIDWYESVLSTRKQTEDSAIVLTMTRWSINDLSGYLAQKEKEGGERFYNFTIKAIDDNDNPIIRPGKRGPNYFFTERESRSQKVWMALFQQDPQLISGNIFAPGNERYFLESDFEKVGGYRKSDIVLGIFVDPAFSSSSKSDDVVVRVAGIHKLTKDFFFFDIFADTQAPSVAIGMIFNLATKWKMKGYNKPFISIEQVNINRDQAKFKKDFMAAMEERGEFYTVIDYHPEGDKMNRIKFNLEPLRTQNKLYYNENISADMKKRTFQQYNQFPNFKKDDIIDCDNQATVVLLKQLKIQQGQEKRSESVVEIIDPITGLPLTFGGQNNGMYPQNYQQR